MQAKTTERAMRDLMTSLEARGELEAAAGVCVAAWKLCLVTQAWHPLQPTAAAAYRLKLGLRNPPAVRDAARSFSTGCTSR